MARRLRKPLLIGCAALVLLFAGLFSLLGVTVAGFSVGTWLVAIGLYKATTPPPAPRVEFRLGSGAVKVVRVELTAKGKLPAETLVFYGADRSDRADLATGPLAVFVGEEPPRADALSALKSASLGEVGQHVPGVGALAALAEIPSWAGGYYSSSLPSLRLPPGGGYVTLLAPDTEIDVEVGADTTEMRMDCGCDLSASVSLDPR